MRRVRTTGQFRKDLKKSVKRGKKIEKLTEIIESLQQGKVLSLAQKDHA
jgi:mRNA interferase YafQ